VRKHEKENVILHFLFPSTGLRWACDELSRIAHAKVSRQSHFCLSVCLPVCRADGTGRRRQV